MDGKQDQYFNLIKNDYQIFLNFLKAKFPVFHNSNFFYRDFHYGVRKFLESKDIKVTYPQAEEIAKKLAEYFEEEKIFIRVNNQAWKINYPEFVTAVPGDPL
jgi:hypothetical protein